MITVTIIENSRREGCEAGCGTDWTLPESLDLAQARVRERFGEDVGISYIDLAAESADTLAIRWAEEAKTRDLGMPLLLVNGRMRISGNFDIRQLVDIVEVEMELEL